MSENQIAQYVDRKMPAAWEVKSKSLKIDMETYKKRAIISIYQNDELLKIAQTDDGASKIMMCVTNAAMMGLQFGGQFPQCEIVGFGKTVYLNIRPSGFKHMVKNSSNPILKDFTVRAVYSGEEFMIDYAGAQVKHSYDGKTEKGELVGVYGIIERLDGEKVVEYMNREDIEKIRSWSPQPNGKAWTKSYDQMALTKAAKRFLKPYAEEKEDKEIMLALMEEEQDPNIEKRVNEHLDTVIEVNAEEAKTETIEPEQTQTAEPQKEPEPPKEENKNQENQNETGKGKKLF